MTRRLFVLVVAVSLSAAARAEDWPEFRGPTGQGLVAGRGLPVEWSATQNVAWKQPIPGLGWSSPVVVEGRIYLTTAVPAAGTKDQSLRALCLDAATGKTFWDVEVFHQDGTKAPAIQKKNSHASPTPLVQDGRLYVHFGHMGTACLDLDGKVRWRNDRLPYRPVHGNGGSPVLADKALIFSADGGDKQFVVALNRDNGEVIWKQDRRTDAVKKFSFSTPLVITVKGQKQVISPGSDVVNAYDPATGKELWRVRYEGYSVVPRPVFGHGLLFVCCGYEPPATLLAIRPDGQGDVTDTHVAWSTRQDVPLNPSPLLAGDELYLVSDRGTASCLDARMGKVHWQERLDGNFSASPVFADGRVYFQSEEGTGVVVKAATRFEKLAENPLDERTLASYAAADGAWFLRTDKHLYRIQAR